jgi:hypothetical protein
VEIGRTLMRHGYRHESDTDQTQVASGSRVSNEIDLKPAGVIARITMRDWRISSRGGTVG